MDVFVRYYVLLAVCFEFVLLSWRLYVRFLASLNAPSNAASSSSTQVSRAVSSSQDAWCPPDVRQGFLKNLVPVPPVGERPQVEAKVKVVNLSMESLLEFKDAHVEHTAHEAPAPTSLFGRRPNYNNRKRKLFAAQPIERKRYLGFECLTLSSWDILAVLEFIWFIAAKASFEWPEPISRSAYDGFQV